MILPVRSSLNTLQDYLVVSKISTLTQVSSPVMEVKSTRTSDEVDAVASARKTVSLNQINGAAAPLYERKGAVAGSDLPQRPLRTLREDRAILQVKTDRVQYS